MSRERVYFIVLGLIKVIVTINIIHVLKVCTSYHSLCCLVFAALSEQLLRDHMFMTSTRKGGGGSSLKEDGFGRYFLEGVGG